MSTKRKLNEQLNAGTAFSPTTETTTGGAATGLEEDGAGWNGADGRKRQRGTTHRGGEAGAWNASNGIGEGGAPRSDHQHRFDMDPTTHPDTSGRGGAPAYVQQYHHPGSIAAEHRNSAVASTCFGHVNDALAGFHISEAHSGHEVSAHYSEMNKVLREAHFELRRKWERQQQLLPAEAPEGDAW